MPNKFSNIVNSRRSILVSVEVATILLVNIFVSWLRFDRDLFAVFFAYPAIPKIFLYPIFWYAALYIVHGWDKSTIPYGNELFTRVISASWRSLLLFSTFAYLAKFPISRIWVAVNIIATTLALLIIRYIIRRSISRRFRDEGVLQYLYVGESKSMKQAIDEFRSNFGFAPSVLRLNAPDESNKSEWIQQYRHTIRSKSINGVIVGYSQISDATLLKEISNLERDRVIDFVLSSRIAPLVRRFELLENPVLVRVRESHITSSGAALKRLFDFFFSFLVLLLLSPLYLLTGLLVKATSKGPIFYIDYRIGRNGKEFMFPKFRSMYIGSDLKRLDTLGRPDEKMFERYRKDPRITPFGRFMRRWSIDEIPQFWCVLIGTMSVVGPRPILREELDQVELDFELRFIAKPGLTGLWQVTGRKEVAWRDRMLRDISYIEDWSFGKDLVLVLKTLSAIISGRGAV